MKLNANEYLALDEIFNGMQDEGSKMDMIADVKDGVRNDFAGYGETSAQDIADRLMVSVSQAKGYISSLAKKGLVCVDDFDGMILITNKGIEVWDSL